MTAALLIINLSIFFANTDSGDVAYADALSRSGDYYRAISEYKKLSFYSTGDSLKAYYNYQIARAYYKSKKYKTSVEYSNILLASKDATEQYHYLANIYLGLSYMESNRSSLASIHFREAMLYNSNGFAKLGLGLMAAKTDRWKEAIRLFSEIAIESINISIRESAKQMLSLSKFGPDLPSKSPKKAAILSAMMPGLGQVYAEHYYDALQAFIFVSSFAYATQSIYLYENEVKNNLTFTFISVPITALFHFSNIIGAKNTAKYRTIKLRDDLFGKLRARYLALEPLIVYYLD